MNDLEVKRQADHLADEGLVIMSLGEQIRHASNEKTCSDLIFKAITESSKAIIAAIKMRDEMIAKQKIVGIVEND